MLTLTYTTYNLYVVKITYRRIVAMNIPERLIGPAILRGLRRQRLPQPHRSRRGARPYPGLLSDRLLHRHRRRPARPRPRPHRAPRAAGGPPARRRPGLARRDRGPCRPGHRLCAGRQAAWPHRRPARRNGARRDALRPAPGRQHRRGRTVPGRDGAWACAPCSAASRLALRAAAVVVSSLLFGLFHFTYPAPWNTLDTAVTVGRCGSPSRPCSPSPAAWWRRFSWTT